MIFLRKETPADNDRRKKVDSQFFNLDIFEDTTWKIGFALGFTRNTIFWSLNRNTYFVIHI